MRGPWWAASQAALAIGLLWVALAVVNLYRRERLYGVPPWPSGALRPGEPLPELVGTGDRGDPVDLGGLSDAIVVLMTEPSPLAYPTVVAAAASAERHHFPLVLALDEAVRLPQGWSGSFPVAVSVVRLASVALRRLRLAHPVSLVLLRGGVVRDALAGPRTFSEIEDRFGVFLGSVPALATREA